MGFNLGFKGLITLYFNKKFRVCVIDVIFFSAAGKMQVMTNLDFPHFHELAMLILWITFQLKTTNLVSVSDYTVLNLHVPILSYIISLSRTALSLKTKHYNFFETSGSNHQCHTTQDLITLS